MRLFLTGLLAFFLGLAAYSLFQPITFYALASLFAYALFFLFFARKQEAAVAFLLGLGLAVELLGGRHLGQGLLFTFVTYGIFIFFGERLRFTSALPRYIVALFLQLVIFAFLLYPVLPIGEFGYRFLHLLGLFPFLAGIAIFLNSFKPSTTYELL